jgi:hypothetical protein
MTIEFYFSSKQPIETFEPSLYFFDNFIQNIKLGMSNLSNDSGNSGGDQRKWFVFVGDAHEGPYTTDDLLHKMDDGTLSSDDYVWSEEMSDWQLMKEVKNFESLFGRQKDNSSPYETLSTDQIPVESINYRSSENFSLPYSPYTLGRYAKLSKRSTYQKTLDTVHSYKRSVRNSKLWKLWKNRNPWPELIVALLATALTLLYQSGFLITAAQKQLNFISQIQGISAEENRDLRGAITEPLEDFGPSVALAVLNPETPLFSFLVSTNLPNNAKFEIHLEGVPETLLGQPSATGMMVVSTTSGFTQSSPFQLAESRSLPRGEYRISVILAAQQPTSVNTTLRKLWRLESLEASRIPTAGKPMLRKSYFLGGPRDSEYDQMLKEYHSTLQEKAKMELVEISQFASTLEDQLKQTTGKFQELLEESPDRESLQRIRWSKFRADWEGLQNKLNPELDKWSPEFGEKEKFHSKLYGLLFQAGRLVNELHDEQNSYFDADSEDQKAMELHIAQTASLAQSVILSVKAKAQLVDKLPTTANGMPARESQ